MRMVAFIMLTLAFLLLLGILCGVLYRSLQADTLQYDRQYLWSDYTVTPESIDYRK